MEIIMGTDLGLHGVELGHRGVDLHLGVGHLLDPEAIDLLRPGPHPALEEHLADNSTLSSCWVAFN